MSQRWKIWLAKIKKGAGSGITWIIYFVFTCLLLLLLLGELLFHSFPLDMKVTKSVKHSRLLATLITLTRKLGGRSPEDASTISWGGFIVSQEQRWRRRSGVLCSNRGHEAVLCLWCGSVFAGTSFAIKCVSGKLQGVVFISVTVEKCSSWI